MDGSHGSTEWLREPSPVAGANLSLVVPGGYFWVVRVLRFRLVTSAQAANRFVQIAFQDMDGLELMAVTASTAIAASKTTDVTCAQGLLAGVVGEANRAQLEFPELLLPAGFKAATSIVNLQSEDQISAVRLWVDQYDDRKNVQRVHRQEVEGVVGVVELGAASAGVP